jgi:hypothetical protein
VVSLGPRHQHLWNRILHRRRPDRPWGLSQALCDLTEEVLDVDAAAISVHLPQGRRELPAASNALAAALEELQFAAGEGPGTDAVRSGHNVLVANVADLRWRWPGFLEPALRRGVKATFAFPIAADSGKPVATLTLYRLNHGTLSEGEMVVVAALQELAGLSLAEDAGALPAATAADRWGHYHTAHIASGIVSVQYQVELGDAMTLLRARALASGEPLLDVARTVCTHRVMTD